MLVGFITNVMVWIVSISRKICYGKLILLLHKTPGALPPAVLGDTQTGALGKT